jgi:hypothetical protein
MSQIAKHNFHRRPQVADAVARTVLLEREVGDFLADAGSDALSPAQAYDLGLNGPPVTWHRAGRRWFAKSVMPPVGVDCLKALDEGLADGAVIREEAAANDSGYFPPEEFDHRCDEDYGPEFDIYWAFVAVEVQKHDEEAAAWDLHECGGVAEDDLPVFLVRVRV